ncbi:MAG TPA: sigma-70 family RNA polymerase sigma factor [Thermoanaerobaculia bacterium]|nr:sigma-70 family RNA polymerase sigma factor [Thermoanaerobaculia bacterium]
MPANALSEGWFAIAKSTMPTAAHDGRTHDRDRQRRFEAVVLPHLDVAYGLARWLTRSDQHAEDVVQTACLRAFQFFDSFQGASARAWLLAIVRNTSYSWIEKHRAEELSTPFEEEVHTPAAGGVATPEPEAELLRRADREMLRAGFAALPVPWREVMVLRELEGLSYKEIAAIGGIPIGTVMSRLARARRQLQSYLTRNGARGTPS